MLYINTLLNKWPTSSILGRKLYNLTVIILFAT